MASYLRAHKGEVVTRYELASLVSLAYGKAFTTGSIHAGFRATGIYPFNPAVIKPVHTTPSRVKKVAKTGRVTPQIRQHLDSQLPELEENPALDPASEFCEVNLPGEYVFSTVLLKDGKTSNYSIAV